MRAWGSSCRYRTKEAFLAALLFFSSVSVLQMLQIPSPRPTEKTEAFLWAIEDSDIPHPATRLTDNTNNNKNQVKNKPIKTEILRFEPEPLNTPSPTQQVSIKGLVNLPSEFSEVMDTKLKRAEFRLEPTRLIGSEGLLEIREFQGNTWSGTFMQGAVVFFVQSSVAHFRRRMLLRKTWASIRDIEGWKFEAVFVVGKAKTKRLQSSLVIENSSYGDMLQYYGNDTDKDSTLKLLAAMQWATENLPGDFHFASTSDDIVLNLGLIKDYFNRELRPVSPPNRISVAASDDGASVASSQPLQLYCFESYREHESTQRQSDIIRSVSMETYSALKWPPYCSEGLYTAPVSFINELYQMSRHVSLTLPPELHDVFVTGILRRNLRRGDSNIKGATSYDLREEVLDRFHVLPASNERKLLTYETKVEESFVSKWSGWYLKIKPRFHIFSNLALI